MSTERAREGSRLAARKRGTLGAWARRGALTLFIVFLLGPLVWMLVVSLRLNAVNTSGELGIPFIPTLEHYRSLFSSINIVRALVNSVISSGAAMVIAVVIGVPSAYALSRLDFQWDWSVMLLPRMLPFIAVIVPWYLFFLFIHLIGSLVAITVAAMVVSLPILVWATTSYFKTIPIEMEEAALLDGANKLQLLWRVIIPLGLPGIVSGAILAWINAWNMFFFPLVLGGTSSGTLPVAAAQFVSYGDIDYGGLAAIATLMVAPVLAVTLYLQRYIVAGLTRGAVRG